MVRSVCGIGVRQGGSLAGFFGNRETVSCSLELFAIERVVSRRSDFKPFQSAGYLHFLTPSHTDRDHFMWAR